VFGELKLITYQVEVILEDFILRADFRPRGEILSFVNDRSWRFLPFENGSLIPVAPDRRIGGAQVQKISINKSEISFLSVLKADVLGDFHLPPDHRLVTFYTNYCAVKGELHVSADAPDEDLLDDQHDFFAMSEASVFPIRPVAVTPSAQNPLILIQQSMIKAYTTKND
jgi:hypothetical protein